MERRPTHTRTAIDYDSAPLILVCSDRQRLTTFGKQLHPALPCRTAANGEAMLHPLRSTSQAIIAAVDIEFLHHFGVNCLRRCVRSPAVISIIIFGVSNAYDNVVSAIYRYPVKSVVYGYDTDLLSEKIFDAWRSFERWNQAHNLPNQTAG